MKTKNDIRAAFFDIDGTLLPFGAAAIPETTVTALHALQKNGVRLFIATGRSPAHMPHLPALQAIAWDGFVTVNGQFCYLADGTVLHEQAIAPAALHTALRYANKERICVDFVQRHTAYFNIVTEKVAVFAKEPGQVDGADIDAAIDAAPTYQLSAFLPLAKEAGFLAHCPGCVAVRWHSDFADILPAGGGKPKGIAAVLAHFGWGREQAIAFGDGGNDASMLAYAGIGVAMGNAWQPAKDAADYITTDIQEQGIPNALRHFGLL